MTTLYGIPNCDTVKKARNWLAANGVVYDFHDYKKQGVTADMLETWCNVLGWERVINRVGTTFRKLPEEAKLGLDRDKAIALMLAQPSMIKRPIIEHSGHTLLGFDAENWSMVITC